MAVNIDAKFEGKMTCAFKNHVRNLANIHQSMFGSLKIETLMVSFHSRQNIYELKIYREVLCYDIEEYDTKFEEELTCQFKIDMSYLTNSDPSARKSQKFALQQAAFDQSI